MEGRNAGSDAAVLSHGKHAIDWILRCKDLDPVGKGKALSNAGQSDHRPVKSVLRG